MFVCQNESEFTQKYMSVSSHGFDVLNTFLPESLAFMKNVQVSNAAVSKFACFISNIKQNPPLSLKF